MLYTELDVDCDQQATVVSALLTTLSDDRCAMAKFYKVWGKSSSWKYHYFYRYPKFTLIVVQD